MSQQTPREPDDWGVLRWPLGPLGVTTFGVFLTAVSILLMYFVFEVLRSDSPTVSGQISVNLFSELHFGVSSDARIILLVVTVGGLGSYIHIATSFISHLGRGRLDQRYLWWYLIRPTIGASLALIFYFVLRGGLLASGAGAEDISLFGIVAVSGLVGMFSARANLKLAELFTTLFGKDEMEEQRNPLPETSGVDPPVLQAGLTQDVALVVSGNNFVKESIVRLDGRNVRTTFDSQTQLTAAVQPSFVASAATIEVTVFNPPPGGGTSGAVQLTIQ